MRVRFAARDDRHLWRRGVLLSGDSAMPIQSLADLQLDALIAARKFTPSPTAWEDEVLYFLLVDRFSDGNENGYRDLNGNLFNAGTTPPFKPADALNAVQTAADAARWRDAGGGYVGGNLAGVTSKLGYLKRMGVTALWLSPVLKQVASQQTYHGYGIQDYLQVNPRFGTADDFKTLVATAHANGMRVILDIILNHTGNVFGYNPNRYLTTDKDGHQFLDPRWDDNRYDVRGFNDSHGEPKLRFVKTDPANPAAFPGPDHALWPVEFQDPATFTCKGRISNFDHDPEFLEGDFFDLKDVHQGAGSVETYQPSPALLNQLQVYKYWMAFADLDGYRVDTVKHMDLGAARLLGSAMKEFAARLSKDNFYLIAEITGGRTRAFDTLNITGLDAALGLDDIPDKLEFLAKGYRNPNDYFSLFRNSELVGQGSHTWFRNKIVTLFNDHDQVSKGSNKARFCADMPKAKGVLCALALNVMTLGIPCIYYGTEQSFDGHGSGDGADRFIREAMFGGEFGAFASRNRHFFDEDSRVYRELQKILRLREADRIYTRGRQYLRPISGDGVNFGFPEMLGAQILSVVPWSRLLDDQEAVLAINTDMDNPRQAWVTIDASLHNSNGKLKCIYSTDTTQIGTELTIEARNGLSVFITVPAAGFVIYR
jgi:glycosidase